MGIKGVWEMTKMQDIDMCRDCRYFMQHYIKDYSSYDGYRECFAGHCVYPRIKDRKRNTRACKYFVEGNYIEEKRRK